MYEVAANLELLFSEQVGDEQHPDPTAERVRAAAALGIRAVEIWLWRTKDLDGLAGALAETGVLLQTMCVEPMGRLTDPATHSTFLSALRESIAAAERLGCPYLVVAAGEALPGVPRAEQRQAVVDALRAAAEILAPHGVTLLLENLNSRVDHVGTFLDSTEECLGILEDVDSPRVRLLYDLYHSLVMEEKPEDVLGNRTDWLAHVQIADVPGRHEPGTGNVDWSDQLSVLEALGYTGRLGLEYVPSTGTARSLRHILGLSTSRGHGA